MKVTLYTKPNCPQCDLTKRDMDILGIEYETVDLTQRQDQLDRLIALGHRSAPVVETAGQTWTGYDQEKIKSLISYVDTIPAHGIDNYVDACQVTLTRERALSELKAHNMEQVDVEEFLAEVGDKPIYSGKEVLDWLGY